jgi:hypothetical protein
MITRKLKIERRAVESILASVVGGTLVTAISQKSWVMGSISVIVAAALLITEKADIEEEE